MAFRVEARLGRSRVVDTFDAILEVRGEKLDVVIKRARPEFRTDAEVQQALLKWGQAQAKVDHPDVVAVLEAGRDADGVYIIQEKVEGATLARLLSTLRKSRRALAPANALYVAERVANAVAALHRSSAEYHGDLRPGEILIGYDGAVKVGDQRLSDLAEIAGRGLGFGDDDDMYLGPEGRAPGAAADAYAAALIIVEMMLGHPVWRTSLMSVDDALRALVDFAPVAQGQPELARQLSDLLRSCLVVAPSLRPTELAPLADGITHVIERHNVRRDADGLGSFVELVSPPLEDADAPTRMAAVAELDAAAASGSGWSADKRAAFEAASVIITPEILAQAEAEYRERRVSERRVPAIPVPSSSEARPLFTSGRKPSSTLEGRSLPVAPMVVAPSSLREVASEVPNFAARAAASIADAEWPPWWPYAVSALIIVVFSWWLLSGDAVRTIQLRVTSEPTAASVYVDDELVGQTPLTRPLQVRADAIELRFEKAGFEAYRVTIGTQEDELRYEAPMKPIGGR